MKKIHFYIISLMISSIIISSCIKDPANQYNSKDSTESQALSSSDCWHRTESSTALSGAITPGNYSIVNNTIRFDNHDEFNKTENFLNNATSSEIQNWYNSIPIITSEKAFQNFMNLYSCIGDDENSQVNSLLNEYGSQIRYSTGADNRLTVSPKFLTYARYRNMAGNFMIGNQIEAESDEVRITIFDGDWNKLTQIRSTPGFPSDTVSYLGDTAFVISKVREMKMPCDVNCCPNNLSETFYFGPDNRRRLQVEISWVEATRNRQDQTTKKWYATPGIDFRLNKLDLDRKNDIGFWTCHNKHFTFTLECNWFIKVVNKVRFNSRDLIVQNNSRTCRVSGDLGLFSSNEEGPFDIPQKNMVCPFKIKFTTRIFDRLDQLPEEIFSVSCLKENNPCFCTICPLGYIFDGFNCFSTICTKNPFIWNNGFYYKPYPNGPNGGICPLGGTFDGFNCYIGRVPLYYEGKAFVWNNCYYVTPKCPEPILP